MSKETSKKKKRRKKKTSRKNDVTKKSHNKRNVVKKLRQKKKRRQKSLLPALVKKNINFWCMSGDTMVRGAKFCLTQGFTNLNVDFSEANL